MPLYYYRKSDNNDIIELRWVDTMKLLSFLFKTNKHQKLVELLLLEGLTASMHELALMSGLGYATTYDLLHKMEKMDLVKKAKQGRSTLFTSNLSSEDLKSFKLLMNRHEVKRKPLADFEELDLPLVGDLREFQKEKAQSLEELLVKTVVLSKKNSTLLRVLPLLVKRLGPRLNSHQLVYWSKQHHVDRELGFLLELTAKLSGEKKFGTLARKLKDNRWGKPEPFLDSEKDLTGFQAMLVEENTPALAKKWFLTMNMGLDSFESHYRKFA